MDSNKKLRQQNKDTSLLPTFEQCRKTITEVNKQYKEFLSQNYSSTRNTSEGQLIDIKRVSHNNDIHEKPGLECNHYDACLTPSMPNQSRCKSRKFKQHQKLKNSKKKLEIHHKTMPNLPPDNQEWKISYYPSKTELLCDTCGQTFTYTSTLRRHMQVQHKPRNLICHECDYQTP